ncbi:NtaA/DmoA family FMN-dependent monooxygenase [Nisaea nitritireducens]|uniref:NtaA/DmoA family FMN-dependent monooxygenase n=1 Tax=Nisaea nitritireducens TaxID=568392 RepID=UPI0018665E97|nr:NtaA/DmoA family FMN-dependent monooxygenase [Nisaea nitritireducens]
MSVREKLRIGMSLAPTWLSGDAWRRSDSEIEQVYSSDYALDIAKRSEAAKLDFVFRPDSLFLNVEALESGPGFGSLDPTIQLASIARETSRIGLLTTISTTFVPPYVVARQLQSLNWISGGRVGWNIVTALDGNENFGLSEMPSAQERYERAAEFAEIVRRLWESYPADALLTDRSSGRYADSTQVRPIDHDGTHLRVKGPLNLPAFGNTRIPLVQAGASPDGRNFASSVADAIFASTPDIEAATELRQDLRRRAEEHGRKASDIRLMPGLSLYLAQSRKEAAALFKETHNRMDSARKLDSILAMTGLDLRDWPQQQRVTAADLPPLPEKLRSRTHAELLRRLILREEPTVADLLTRPEVIGSAHWQIIGTVDDAVAEIVKWQSAGAIDGFIAVPGGSVSSMHLVLDELVPRLAEMRLFRSDYSGKTFLDHLEE